MGCNCGGGSVPNPIPSTPKRPERKRPKGNKVHVIPNQMQYCEVCGWLMAKISYVDVTSKKRIQKYTCANRKCQKYNT